MGVLFAEFLDETPVCYSAFRAIYVAVFNLLQHLFEGSAVGDYDAANQSMLAEYNTKQENRAKTREFQSQKSRSHR